MNDELYLTDEQYLRILKRIRVTVTSEGFEGGFCNDAYTERDTALFPDQFPGRRTMKYRGKNHRCPFDMRNNPDILGWGNGCFFECYLFKHLGKRDWGLSLMYEMVDHAIEVAI